MNLLRSKTRGFSLLELMVCVSILVVLVALLTPALKQARESSKASQCVNNLHQIGVAIQLYAEASSDTYPPCQYINNGDLNTVSNEWSNMISPYLGGTVHERGKVFVCLSHVLSVIGNPDYPHDNYPTYAINQGICPSYDTVWGYPYFPPWFIPPIYPAYPIQTKSIKYPAELILVADAIQHTELGGRVRPYFDHSTTPWGDPAEAETGDDPSNWDYDGDFSFSTSTGQIRFRHLGSFNAVLCDGHVESFRHAYVDDVWTWHYPTKQKNFCFYQ